MRELYIWIDWETINRKNSFWYKMDSMGTGRPKKKGRIFAMKWESGRYEKTDVGMGWNEWEKTTETND